MTGDKNSRIVPGSQRRNLSEADLAEADLRQAKLNEASLIRANLSGQAFRGASLSQTLPATQRKHQLLERKEFDRICDEVGGISDKEALLNFLHDDGVIFYRVELLDDYIVLDQNWALEAIYAPLQPKECRCFEVTGALAATILKRSSGRAIRLSNKRSFSA